MKAFLKSAFVDNIAMKLVSLAIAVTLFVLVRGDKETERVVRVAVAYIRPADRVLVSEVPEGIDVWVRGPWTRIKRLDPSDIDPIVLDLTKVPDGDLTIAEDMIRLPVGLRVASIRPAKINLVFENVKKVAVVPEPVGAPAKGFIVEKITPDPVTVTLRGPKALVDEIADVRTLPISIAGKRASFREMAPLAPLAKGLSLDATEVDVGVEIEEEVGARTLTAVPVVVAPPPGATVKPAGFDVIPDHVDITLRGARNAIDQVDEKKITASVELHLDDYSPGKWRSATVMVSGVPAGVAIDLAPREVTLTMRLPGPGLH